METAQTACNYLWRKYRPVVLRLMMDAKEDSQQYVFSSDEFRKMFPKSSRKLAFILYLHRSRALNNIKSSVLAQSLVDVLRQSKTSASLCNDATFEFVLDEQFIFHVRRNRVVPDQSGVAIIPIRQSSTPG